MFKDLAYAVKERIDYLYTKGDLFYVDINKDELWEKYINNFEVIHKQVHNCNTCKSFIKSIGGLVYINDNLELESIWDIDISLLDNIYSQPILELNKYVKNCNIKNIFIATQNKYSKDFSGGFYHLHCHINESLVYSSLNANAKKSEMIDRFNVLKRTLKEVNKNIIQDTINLLEENNLHKKDTYISLLKVFIEVYDKYSSLESNKKDLYCWKKAIKNPYICRIMNTSVGILIKDIQEKRDTEISLRKYLKAVDPYNYNRPLKIFTQSQLDELKNTLEDLGYENSIYRTYANDEDIPLEEIYYKDSSISNINNSNVFDQLQNDILINPKKYENTPDVDIDTFINMYLKSTNKLEVLILPELESNLVSLIAPKYKDSKSLFYWNNNISWSYKEGLSDADIREKVLKQGGKIEGEILIRLNWKNNLSDYDLHVIQPNGTKIYYQKMFDRYTGANQDVDMNVNVNTASLDAVENIVFPYSHKAQEGVYIVLVNNFTDRTKNEYGFVVEVECKGDIYKYNYNNRLRNKETIEVVKFIYDRDKGIRIVSSINESSKGNKSLKSEEFWGLETYKFYPIKMIFPSPNTWKDNNHPDKHIFFIVKGCKNNNDNTKPFFNNFLNREILDGRKRVLESLSSKLQVEDNGSQLNGLGFNSTANKTLICRLDDKQVVKVKF